MKPTERRPHGILDGCELHVTIEGVSFVITLETA
jgi:hypothetical protein